MVGVVLFPVEVMRIELTTSSMRPKRSSQLSYTPGEGTMRIAGERLTQKALEPKLSLQPGAAPAWCGQP